MKRLFLMLIPAIICVVVFSSCNTENTKPEKNEPDKTPSELYVIGAKSESLPTDKTNLVFTDEDIELYNISNGEIIFAEAKFAEILNLVNLHNVLHFLIDDNPVFDPPIRIHYGWDICFEDYDLQFRTDGYRTFLTDDFFCLDSLNFNDVEIRKEKRNAELEVLIEYLKDKGKTVNRDEDMPGYQKSSLCDILYFGDSINVVNWTIKENRITGIYPAEINLSSIIPTIVVSEKASVNPQSLKAVDFSNKKTVTYTVTAEDGTVKIYTAQAFE